MPLTVGSRLGHYDVTALIGEGGMGQVYQATDTKLNRQVALKILPEAFATDPDRLARFQREAQVLASLNHPNIAAIHGLEDSEGTKALVLELVEGPTLADRIAQGPIPIDEALPIAKQIAEALEAAHEAGVIHRDLKPANIKVREDGTVKVLDFGLAKAFQPDASDPNLSQSPTISLTAAATQMGMVIGTAAYMAPEQAKGKTVDKRADVWAFGAVLYEMLTGARPFVGEDVSDTMAAVLRLEVDWSALPNDVSPVLATYLRRCLEKNPRQRIHDIADVRLALEGAFEAAVGTRPKDTGDEPGLRLRPVVIMASTFLSLGLGALASWSVMRSEPPSPPLTVARFAIADPLTVTNDNRDLALSRQGRFVVYFAGIDTERQLYVRPIDQLEATAIRQSDNFFDPFLSPDGAWVGFIDQAESRLTRMSTRGGPPSTICEVEGDLRGATWAPDDTIIFATSESNSGLWRVAAAGGTPTVVTTPDLEAGEDGHRWPHLLPGNKGVLFTIFETSGRPENARIAVLDFETGALKILIQGGSNARYSPTGHLVYGTEGGLWAVPFDQDSLEVVGAPDLVVEGVATKPSGAVNFALSQDGSLVYVSGTAERGVERTLVWVDREGREESLTAPAGAYQAPRISPDGTRVALTMFDQGGDIWIWNLAGETMMRLTFDPGRDSSPTWTNDGRAVLFASRREGTTQVFRRASDGTGSFEQLTDSPVNVLPYDVSAAGMRVVLSSNDPKTGRGLHVMELGSQRGSEVLLDAEFDESSASLSPNDRWIAYQSNESGRDEIYVRPFPEIEEGRWQVSADGGRHPVWSQDGRELFYQSSGRMVSLPVQTSSTFSFGPAESLFEGDYRFGVAGRTFDVTPDGQRFLMIKPLTSADDPAAPRINVVLNWFEELKERVPVN